MAKHEKIAGQYAKAAYDFLKSSEKAQALAQELSSFSKVVNGNPELVLVLSSRVFSAAQRRSIVLDIVGKMGLSEDAKKFLAVIAESGRMMALEAIAEKLRALGLEASGVVPLKVESAVELDSGEKSKLEQKFKTLLGKKVEASYQLDSHLLGGMRVTAAGRTYDGSVIGTLNVLEEKLVGGTL